MISYKFFQKYFRNNLRPIAKDDATIWRERLSKLYMFLGFNCLGLIIFATYKYDLDLVPKKDGLGSHKYGKLAYGETVHVMEFKGMKKVNEYDIVGGKEEKEK